MARTMINYAENTVLFMLAAGFLYHISGYIAIMLAVAFVNMGL